jgi:hypothetical protein
MLTSDQDDEVVYRATSVLAMIAQRLDGAQAMVDAKVQDYILKWLKSQSSHVRIVTCELIGSLARHKPAVLAILELNLSKQLVALAG